MTLTALGSSPWLLTGVSAIIAGVVPRLHSARAERSMDADRPARRPRRSDRHGSARGVGVRSKTMVRCAVLVLAALLAIDASWCCDDTILLQPSTTTTFITGGNGACGDDGGQLDCHACICSGLALVETVPLYGPPLRSIALVTIATGHPMSVSPAIDIPPDRRT